MESRALTLSFPPIDRDQPATPLTDDFAVMLVGIAARQAASPTALLAHQRQEYAPTPTLLASDHGAFNQAVAEDLKRWKEEAPGLPEE